jgi:hypothetical protein
VKGGPTFIQAVVRIIEWQHFGEQRNPLPESLSHSRNLRRGKPERRLDVLVEDETSLRQLLQLIQAPEKALAFV